jgi:hypothetical protein
VTRHFATPAAQLALICTLAAGCAPAERPQDETARLGGAAPAAVTTQASAAAAIPRAACSLITIEEASKILGSPATATPGSSSADRSGCDYVTQSFQAFTLEAVWSGAEEEIRTARNAATTAAAAAGGTQDQVVNEVMGVHRVDGLGDEAYFVRRGMSYARKGDVLLVIHTAGLQEPARANFEALARVALGRL